MVCQRMLKEREEQVRLEFGKILDAKLAGDVSTLLIFLTHGTGVIWHWLQTNNIHCMYIAVSFVLCLQNNMIPLSSSHMTKWRDD